MAIQSLENFIIFPVNKYKTNSKETGKDQPIQIKHCFVIFNKNKGIIKVVYNILIFITLFFYNFNLKNVVFY